MSKTQGRWEQATGFTDGQIFVGASEFQPTAASGAVTLVSASAGLLTRNVAASLTANLFADISKLLRTGQLATAAVAQEQFGTAALVPGPSSVANTSDPLDFPPGFPPWTETVLPTITGGQKGPIPKGIKPIWVDVIYEIDTGAITSVTFGLTQTAMPASGASGAPTVTNIITLGANSLPVAANTAGQATRTRIAVASANQLYITTDGTEVIANVNFVTPAGNSVKFYGIILGCHFNYN
jgi:hypothetical protein